MAENSQKDKQSEISDGGNVDLMTGGEVADFLRVHIASVRRWARSGQLRGYRLGGRGDWRFHRKDVMSFLSGLTGQP
jgi:excisionase family DNA binding protein